MILTQDQEPKRLIEELQEEGFTQGDMAKGELNEVLIENGVPLFFLSFFGELTYVENGDGGELPKMVDFDIPISVLDGWYEINEVKITTTEDKVIIKGTESTKFVSTIPQQP